MSDHYGTTTKSLRTFLVDAATQVAILDGNGNEHVFYEEPHVLQMSSCSCAVSTHWITPKSSEIVCTRLQSLAAMVLVARLATKGPMRVATTWWSTGGGKHQ